jgi:hypothetical protein
MMLPLPIAQGVPSADFVRLVFQQAFLTPDCLNKDIVEKSPALKSAN